MSTTTTRPGHAGLGIHTLHLARRQLRLAARTPEAIAPSLVVPLLFYAVQRGSLDTAVAQFGIDTPANFFLPVVILMAVSSSGAGLTLAGDIATGYLDKLMLTRVTRPALLLGAMAGDLLRTTLQIGIVVALGLITGLDLGNGIGGLLVLTALALGWTLAYSAIGYAIALRTGNPTAIQGTIMLFFPFVFFTTSFVPRDGLTGWMDTIAGLNPVTYVLDAMRTSLNSTWDAQTLLLGAGALAVVGALTWTAALTAFTARTR